jgi:hypothetical protein
VHPLYKYVLILHHYSPSPNSTFFAQKSIQDELTARNFSPDAGERSVLYAARNSMLIAVIDPVMAEYITIMIINNKTAGM